jgi:molybdenum cofactor cytidylyltransferase
MKVNNSKGWTEAIVVENCPVQEFLKIAGILQISLNISFQNKLSDTDSIYWDFIYKEKELTLHYNTYDGISIFPKALKNATNSDNQIVLDLFEKLSDNLEKFNNLGNFVSKYFDPEPTQWGLRGDPHLWRDMKLKTAKTNIPATGNEFEKLLHKLFKELTGENPQKGKNIYVKKYETVGMSKGMISSDFWLDKGFSLLIQRYIESELR